MQQGRSGSSHVSSTSERLRRSTWCPAETGQLNFDVLYLGDATNRSHLESVQREPPWGIEPARRPSSAFRLRVRSRRAAVSRRQRSSRAAPLRRVLCNSCSLVPRTPNAGEHRSPRCCLR